ncbi:MAG: acetyl/propionyl/methylcrotonyl-CoA carboxylase subunit alpha [Rhodospirillaceae bacterium]|jgi:propionyl-CoA carboxylase alpha chain|nr:acetyl/propionyl/methylcrotonyl-CoA carboxylase subunit alpha [Rhodospirillaceae bacterium]MBT5358481.1 acetyl/propionyl/methylcrotonyl-CoA carboxylase subunit alpha [Rhodospirillaceae bacterium]MBT5768834.1 acetyl/propionyl/methylcrotonyl-CoA carboxylase subunit alpha [Rhodospirillaceae bacterium]MBT6310376.1 acetyl/propionyl/methylcrotonyl-CoA carboxylase subunit alpha [Rhodospirillaceae bacterium]MBT7363291.1 acetyl/propionyl/methylcrotonyl-CoA carboxylase subunit alpha [Rhodospirillaceae
MFKKILIANRGEIACRVIRSAKDMGIATVAVYSDADAGALHVRMADEAVHIGPPPASESYLVMEKILAAIRDTGADAVHPGYGFLSENADFARALEAEGVAFIGPPPDAIAAMGDKIESKKLADAAGVSTVPGHMDTIADVAEAVKIAGEVGYPVMIKASAGGGGKGMRIAYSEDEVDEGFRSAQNEARSSFGDDRIFIEKYVEEPRHIEIQVLADAHGNVIHLGERECSIQRRHQKVVEEAPSPFLDAEMREAMGAQSCALAAAVGYRSAGTVEFIVDKDRNFYFLEMNTRLQVEHPVTEMITGLDLVEQMIRVANGEKLSLRQEDVKIDGWAVETRVYAEDPRRNFLPAIGRLVRYRAPVQDGINVRIDTGVGEGSEISMFYDPMIAKLATHGADRNQAITRMQDALDGYFIRGTGHNTAFLASIMAHPRFVEGRLTTNFIAEEYPDGYAPAAPEGALRDRFSAVAAYIHGRFAARARQSGANGSPELPGNVTPWQVQMGDISDAVAVTYRPDGADVAIDGRSLSFSTDWTLGNPVFAATFEDGVATFQIDRTGVAYRLTHRGVEANVRVLTPRGAALDERMPEKIPPDLSRFVLSPMPGLLVSVAVEEGMPVSAGEEIAVVEAMKMENVLRATSDGVVKTVHAGPGDSLAVDQAIVEFE